MTVIDLMKATDRFPIPESLVNRPKEKKGYNLRIDSLITAAYTLDTVNDWANYLPRLDAPYNSMESEEEFPIDDSEESDDKNKIPYIPKAKLEENPELLNKQFDDTILKTMPWRIESMRYFPYSGADNTFPVKLLKIPRLQTLFEAHDEIEKQQANQRWSKELIQNVFEYFCMEMKAAVIDLEQFYNYEDPNCYKVSIKNFTLDEQVMKAIIMIIPYMLDFVEIEFQNNQINDNIAAALIFAIFANPSVRRITIAYNFMKSGLTKSLSKLMQMKPHKIDEINLMGSIFMPENVQPLIRTLPTNKNMRSLNLAGCPMSHSSARLISQFVLINFTLSHLDISHCKINYQGSRYIIDALNRNTTIRNFNFSHNDLTSEKFEFAIKIASIITRHPLLMHLDITNTNLKREEIIFIGLSLPISKTLLSCHLTAQKLPYYERIFLRAAIAARVEYRTTKRMRKYVNSNKDRNQILTMGTGEVQEVPMKAYITQLQDFDIKREGLDIEISELLAEMDTQTSLPEVKIKPKPQADDATEESEEKSKMALIVDKLVERQKEIDAQRKLVEEAYKKHSRDVRGELAALEGVADLEREMHEMFGDPSKQQAFRSPEKQSNWFEKMKELRTERQRIKAEIEVIKEAKDRSAGELALMFMGINQVAQDLLMENPMTGYMQEIIFSRVLGQDDIEQGTFWVDTFQCWVCQKWDKVTLKVDETAEKVFFQQQIDKVEQLHVRINQAVEEQMRIEELKLAQEHELESIDANSFIDVTTQQEHTHRFSPQSRPGSLLKTGKFDENSNNLAIASFQPQSVALGSFQPQSAAFGSFQPQSAGNRDAGLTVSDIQGVNNNPSKSNSNEDSKGKQKSDLDSRSNKSKTQDVIEEKYEEEDDQVGVIDEANIGLSRGSTPSQADVGQAMVNPVGKYNDDSNIMSPVKTTRQMITKRVFPDHFTSVNKFNYKIPRPETLYPEELAKLDTLNRHAVGQDRNPKNTMIVKPIMRIQEPLLQNIGQVHLRRHDSTRNMLESKDGSSIVGDGVNSSVISHTESKRRKHGDPVIIQRQVFFEGVVYMIEEELYSDSDHSSIYTSEDDFDLDRNVQMRLRANNRIFNQSEFSKSLKVSAKFLESDAGGRYSAFSEFGEKFGGEGTPMKQVSVHNIDSESEAQSNLDRISEASVSDKQEDKKSDNTEAFQKARKVDINRAARAQQVNVEIFTNSPGLNQRQKDYETKAQPRHYRKDKGNTRVAYFEKNLPKLKKTQRGGEIYVCASFNDWIPVQTKTMRRLMLERYPIEYPLNEIPKQIFTMDNVAKLSAQMVPPGYHYFYFAREKGQIFLSPLHEVVRFKSTNVFLNRVKVAKRLEDFDTVHQANVGEDDEAVFMLDRSVFRDFREDTNQHLRKCFEEDWQFGKVRRVINKRGDQDTEEQEIKDFLFGEYVSIINIFNYYSGRSSYPTISMNDFTSFAGECKILDHHHINLAALDLLLVATCVSTNEYINSAEKDLQRYEFLEIIVRIALDRYKAKGFVQTIVEGIEKVLYELIYPHARKMDGTYFRRYYCYNVKTNEILKKNEPLIRRVYDSFTHAKKRYIMMPECQSYVRKMGLNISEMMVGAIYAESMMTIIDTIRDQTRPNQMKFVEFLIFLCRIAHEHYKTGPYNPEPLYLKIEHLMSHFLSHLSLSPTFLFGEKFGLDLKAERKRAKKKYKQLLQQQKRFKETGEPVDQALQKQVDAYKKTMPLRLPLSSDSEDNPSPLQTRKQGSLMNKMTETLQVPTTNQNSEADPLSPTINNTNEEVSQFNATGDPAPQNEDDQQETQKE